MVHTVTRRHPRRPPAASEHSSTRVHGCSRTASSSKSKCLHKGQQHRAARKLNFLLRDGRTSAAWRRLLAAQHGKQATRQTGDKAIEKRGQKNEGRHGKRGRPLPAEPFVLRCTCSAGRNRTCKRRNVGQGNGWYAR